MAVRSGPLRWLLFAAGALATGLGILGFFLPLLPSTPFLLLAAACFSRSSERAERWLFANPLWGRQLQQYRAHGTVSPRTKALAIATIALGMTFSAWLTGWNPIIILAFLVIGGSVSLYLLRLPTTRTGLETRD